jgi:protein ImuB
MPKRRILSLWFPRLAAERCLRETRGLPPGPFAVVGDERNAQVLVSLSAEAEAAGLTRGQPLRDATSSQVPAASSAASMPQISKLGSA